MKIAQIIMIVLVTAFVGFMAYGFFRSPVGPSEPAIDPQAICTIAKDSRSIYAVLCKKGASESYKKYIAKSKEVLDPFVGKKVAIQAHYLPNIFNTDSVTTNKQCVQNKCQQIFQNKNQETFGIVIDKISVK